MKKTLLAAFVVLTAGIASAASFTWTTSKLSFGETVLKNTEVSAYLIYLGNGVSQLGSVSVTDTSTADSIAASFGASATVAKDYSVTTSRTGIASDKLSFSAGSGDYVSGDKFALLLSYVSDGKTYFNLSTTGSMYSLSVPTETPEIATYGDADYSFGNTVVGESKTLSSGGGWTVAVPEPSVALMGLLGLGMLLKRRRA